MSHRGSSSTAVAAAAANVGNVRLVSRGVSDAASAAMRRGNSVGRGGGPSKGPGRDDFVVGLSTLESTLASTVAGVINVMATTPLWVSNLRIKAGKGVGGLLSTLAAIGR